MAADKDSIPAKSQAKDGEETPGWANGLRHLYDSVVDEPIPDSFKDLLAKLDDGPSDTGNSL